MKKTMLVLFVSVVFSGYSFSQKPCDAFTSNEITWYGLDFSFARMIGGGFENPSNIKNSYFSSWNMLFVKEAKKYDIGKFFYKKTVLNNFDIVTERNSKVDETKLVTINTTDTVNVSQSLIKDALKKYTTSTNKGVGLVFFIESFNKYTESATISIVFFDITTKEVLAIKKLKGIPLGVGLRNYWAGAIFKVLQQCENDYSGWKKEYCG